MIGFWAGLTWAAPPPNPLVANPFSTNRPPNGITNAVYILQNNELRVRDLIATTNSINGALNVRSFGAAIDGVTDDSDAVQAALDSVGDAGGGSLFFPVGTCLLMKDLIVPDNVFLYGVYGSELDFESAVITNACLLAEGSLTELDTLAATVPFNGTAIALNSAPAVSPNDVVVLWNTNQFSYSPYRAEYYQGEYCLVKSVGGSTLLLSAPTYAEYVPADTKVYKMNPVRVGFSSLKILGKNGDQVPVIKIKHGQDVFLDNLVLSGSEYTQILIDRGYEISITRNVATDYSGNTGINYGAFVGNSQRVTVTGNQFNTTRHGLSFGGNDQTASVPCREIVIDGNIIGSTGNIYGLNLHGNCAEFVISDNVLPNGMECPDRGIVKGNRIRGSNNNRYAFTDNAELTGNKIQFLGNYVEAVGTFNEGLIKWTSVSNCVGGLSPIFADNIVETYDYARNDYPSSPTDVLRVTMAAGGQTNCWPMIHHNKFYTSNGDVGDFYPIRILTASTNAGFYGVTITDNELEGGGIGVDANVAFGEINGNKVLNSLGAGIDVRFNANPQMVGQVWNIHDNLVSYANKAGVKITPDAAGEIYATRNRLRNNARTHQGSSLDTGFYCPQASLVYFEGNFLYGSAPQTNLYTIAATTVIDRFNVQLGMSGQSVTATTNIAVGSFEVPYQHPNLGLRGDAHLKWFPTEKTLGIGDESSGIANWPLRIVDSVAGTWNFQISNTSLNAAAAARLNVWSGNASAYLQTADSGYAATNQASRISLVANASAANGVGLFAETANQTIDLWTSAGLGLRALSTGGGVSIPGRAFTGSTFGTNGLYVPNNVSIYSRDLADTEDLNLIKRRTDNELEIATLTNATRVLYGLSIGTLASPRDDPTGGKVLLDVNQRAAITQASANLTGDNVTVTASVNHLLLNSDDATPANRTFVLNNAGVSGQWLILMVTTGAAQLVDDSAISGGAGNVKLSANWEPAAFDTLKLYCDGTNWVEVSRSNN